MQALAYRKALARRPDWDHPIKFAVVEVCVNTGYNWFDRWSGEHPERPLLLFLGCWRHRGILLLCYAERANKNDA
jgi:hypothetical protein